MTAAGALFLFGAVTVALSFQLPIGTLRAAGSGLFPLVLGLLLMGLAACHLLLLLRTRDAAARVPTEERVSYRRVVLFLGAVAAATALLAPLGYILSAFLLLWSLMEILGVRPRILSLVVSLLTAGFSHLLFMQWLQIPLPKGWWGL